MTRALEILLQYAEQARDQAQADCQQARARQRALQQQGEALLGYQRDTQARDPAREGRSSGIHELLTHRSFMERLHQALQLLRNQEDHAALQTRACEADLLARELRLAQVQKLSDRRQVESQRLQDRQEQRSSDDAAQQRLLHTRSGFDAKADGGASH